MMNFSQLMFFIAATTFVRNSILSKLFVSNIVSNISQHSINVICKQLTSIREDTIFRLGKSDTTEEIMVFNLNFIR